MKSSLLFSMAVALVLTGCSGNNSSSTGSGSSTASSSSSTAKPASADYLTTLMRADKSSQNKIDTVALNKALEQFNVQEGRYPQKLEELVPAYIPKIPTPPLGYKINYDATKGQVTVVTQ